MARISNIPLSALLAGVTKAQALASILEMFQSLEFSVTSWRSGGVGLTVAHFLAEWVRQKADSVALIAGGGLLDYARGDWLTLLAKAFYDEDRTPAGFTFGKIVLTSSDGAPPHTLKPNQVWVGNAAGLRFNTTEGGILASGSSETLELEVIAEHPGQDYNVGNGTITELFTALPGVSVSNPAYGGTGTWITTQGVDEQSDSVLIQQCRDKWATLAYADPAAKYRYYARAASSQVTRVWVDDQNPDGPGTLSIYLAGPAGGITDSAVIALVETSIAAKRGICANPSVYGATNVSVPITGSVYYRDVIASAAESSVEAALAAFFSALEIGGEVIEPNPGKVFRDAIIEKMRPTGIVHVNLTAPLVDVELAENEVAVPDYSALSYVSA